MFHDARCSSSPVHGFPVRNNSCRWTFRFKLSMLVNSPTKFNVRSSFCSDSHAPRFSIFSMLFIARFKYSSFFNLLRFSARVQASKLEKWNKNFHVWRGELSYVRVCITDSRDQIRLEEEDFQLTAQLLNVLDPLNIFLMQWKLLEAENEKFIVFSFLSDESFRNWGENLLWELEENLNLQFTFNHFTEL